MLSPSFANVSLSASLQRAEGAGISGGAGQFNVGDTYVVPLWLDWTGKHYDAIANYGFYIPTGKYNITTVNVPVVGPLRVESPDSVGLGFWENQIQSGLYLYPWADRRMAIENAMTWEINQSKRGFDLTQGQHLTWNWGVSQYLPLKKDKSLLAEIGPAGYANFQVSDDTGADARSPGVHDKIYSAGLQLGITMPKRMRVLNFHWFHEFSAVDRFQGNVYGLSFVARLGSALAELFPDRPSPPFHMLSLPLTERGKLASYSSIFESRPYGKECFPGSAQVRTDSPGWVRVGGKSDLGWTGPRF